MTCAPGGCGCGHEHDGHDGHDQHDTNHGAGCCGSPAVNEDNPKTAEKA